MKKIIHHLRRQPEEARRHILHMAVIAIGVILMIFWVYSLGRTVTDDRTQKKVSEEFGQLVPLDDNTEIPEIW